MKAANMITKNPSAKEDFKGNHIEHKVENGHVGLRDWKSRRNDWSLGVDATKFSNQSYKDWSLQKEKSSREYSFKDRSFKGKDLSFPFCNDFSEILEICESQFLCQVSILRL